MLGSNYLIGGALAVLGVAVATEPAAEATFGPTFWATVGLIVTTVLGFIFQAYRESRDRRWKREDAGAKAEMVEKLDANTEITKQGLEFNKQAIAVANNFNAKLAQSHADLAQSVQSVAVAAETVAAAAQQVTPPPANP